MTNPHKTVHFHFHAPCMIFHTRPLSWGVHHTWWNPPQRTGPSCFISNNLHKKKSFSSSSPPTLPGLHLPDFHFSSGVFKEKSRKTSILESIYDLPPHLLYCILPTRTHPIPFFLFMRTGPWNWRSGPSPLFANPRAQSKHLSLSYCDNASVRIPYFPHVGGAWIQCQSEFLNDTWAFLSCSPNP